MTKENVLLIVLDAVRRDHLSVYGYERNTTPNIDRLAEDSYLFENAFSNSNWTGTSHGAMFTGMLPSESGIFGESQQLPTDIATLPEIFQKEGYRTFSTSAGIHLRSSRGYDRGFDKFHESYRIKPRLSYLGEFLKNTDAIKQLTYTLTKGHDNYTFYKTNLLKKWLTSGEEPFFAFVNFKTAHHRYDPPRPYKKSFCEDLSRPPLHLIELIMEKFGKEPQDLSGEDIRKIREISKKYPILGGEIDPTADEIEIVKSWYDGAIKYLDEKVGEIIEYLKSNSMYENTTIIITSDHGELFGEHGLEKHRYSLYEEVLEVPLIIRRPSDKSVQVKDMTSLIDLYPTLSDISGNEQYNSKKASNLFPVQNYHDRVFAEVGNKSPTPVQKDYPEFSGSDQNGPLQCVRDDNYKIIQHADGASELYEWKRDSIEQQDTSGENNEVVNELNLIIEDELGDLDDSIPDKEIESEELKEQLESLGYL